MPPHHPLVIIFRDPITRELKNRNALYDMINEPNTKENGLKQ